MTAAVQLHDVRETLSSVRTDRTVADVGRPLLSVAGRLVTAEEMRAQLGVGAAVPLEDVTTVYAQRVRLVRPRLGFVRVCLDDGGLLCPVYAQRVRLVCLPPPVSRRVLFPVYGAAVPLEDETTVCRRATRPPGVLASPCFPACFVCLLYTSPSPRD